MHYAVSDIHGCYDKYERLLQKLNLGEKDVLYVLGDVIDRGPDGIRILEDIMERSNVVMLPGNHEIEGFTILKALSKCPPRSKKRLDALDALKDWREYNGGTPTCKAFWQLPQEKQKAMLRFIDQLPCYEEVEVNGRRFFLAHTVPECEKLADPDSWTVYDFTYSRPDYGKRPFPDREVVCGHTPTFFLSDKFMGKVVHLPGLYDIDCGAVFDQPLACLCLENDTVYYVRSA